MKLHNVTTLKQYCKTINIPPPVLPDFDIRRFEDNMKTVNLKQKPFRHQFYAVAMKTWWHERTVFWMDDVHNLFFNTPYQVVSWDIYPDWEGRYIAFWQEFIQKNPKRTSFVSTYDFFTLDQTLTFDLSEADTQFMNSLFERIHQSVHTEKERINYDVLVCVVELMLQLVSKHYKKFLELNPDTPLSSKRRSLESELFAKFQELLWSTICVKPWTDGQYRKPAYYAKQLWIKPNYLNNICTKIAWQSTTQVINTYLISLAKSLLMDWKPVKEVAYSLHFGDPAYFSRFFKRNTWLSPVWFVQQCEGLLLT